MNRLITERQEQIYQLRHHDFAGLTTKQVATMLSITPQCVNRDMKKMKKIAPQLFPILTSKQMNVYVLREMLGMTYQEISKYLGITWQTAACTVYYMRKKGMYLQPDCIHRVNTYSPWMDSKVKQKF